MLKFQLKKIYVRVTGTYHKHMRRNIYGKQENRAGRSEERTSLRLGFEHCNSVSK